jgi:divalent metal cation (Fe/Co/Zn/Cd) transporter
MGLNFYVDLHVKVDGAISVRDGHAIAHEVKNTICGTDLRIADVLVHVEPASASLDGQVLAAN